MISISTLRNVFLGFGQHTKNKLPGTLKQKYWFRHHFVCLLAYLFDLFFWRQGHLTQANINLLILLYSFGKCRNYRHVLLPSISTDLKQITWLPLVTLPKIKQTNKKTIKLVNSYMSRFSHCWDKTHDRSNLREEGGLFWVTVWGSTAPHPGRHDSRWSSTHPGRSRKQSRSRGLEPCPSHLPPPARLLS